MELKNQSIGIFDSGIGGLTVANAISKLLPNEKLIYFGDTQHMPYGDKSSELIKEYSIRISKYLIEEKSCKAIVIACNTASSVAYSHLKEKYLGHIPIINVIDPMVELIAETNFKKIGIIATLATIRSGTYQEKLSRRCPHATIASLATPLLAPMIEDNFINDNVSHTIIEKYLSDPIFEDIEALVLACTHYPLIAHEISEFFNHKVKLLTSGEPVAQKLKWILEKQNLLSENKEKVADEYYVTDLSDTFSQAANKFNQKEIILNEVSL